MNSLVVTLRLGAIFVGASLPLSALAADRGLAGKDFTLLTGPYLLSPPTRPLNAASISSEVVTPGQPAKVTFEPLRQKDGDATKRVLELRAELAEQRERNKKSDETFNGVFRAPATPSTTEAIRFDARVLAPSADLLRFDSTLHPPSPPPTFHFRATAPTRE
jgi:hypothetical protein